MDIVWDALSWKSTRGHFRGNRTTRTADDALTGPAVADRGHAVGAAAKIIATMVA